MNNKSFSFKNITKVANRNDAYQIKLKRNNQEFQPYLTSLHSAIKVRNECYKQANYRPNHLFVNMFDLSSLAPHPRAGFQVHARRLKDRKYTPRQFSSQGDAKEFALRWIEAYNAIAAVYNEKREAAFLEQIELELIELKPHIKVFFSPELWAESAKSIFGESIPDYF